MARMRSSSRTYSSSTIPHRTRRYCDGIPTSFGCTNDYTSSDPAPSCRICRRSRRSVVSRPNSSRIVVGASRNSSGGPCCIRNCGIRRVYRRSSGRMMLRSSARRAAASSAAMATATAIIPSSIPSGNTVGRMPIREGGARCRRRSRRASAGRGHSTSRRRTPRGSRSGSARRGRHSRGNWYRVPTTTCSTRSSGTSSRSACR